MPIESEADRAVFLNADEFGATAIYTTAGGVASDPIPGQFDNPTATREIGERAAVADARPTFTCRTADLPDDAAGGDAGDLLEVGVVSYRVLDVLPDGTGFTHITLGASS